jgi:hypothetical protein
MLSVFAAAFSAVVFPRDARDHSDVDVWVHHREHQGERIVSPGVNVQEDLVTHTVRRPSDRRSPATSWWMRPQQALHRFEKRFFPSLRSHVHSSCA